MKDIIIKRLKELEEEYERELKNGSGEHASDNAKDYHGEIRGLKWVLENWVE